MNAGPSVIEVCGVSKRFRLRGTGVTLKSMVLDRVRRRRPPGFDALSDISFSVRSGETLGIIGANGAGKSTLLALIAGTIEPTRGRIRTEGTIASLLELGAGFHPDLTGRENVFLYGAIMGISQRRMRARFDAICAFAGIGDYIDQPVKHYSSGMYVRLGFAVAVEVDPDILLVDEVLAVGDEGFQRKCLRKMADFRAQGKTLLIISHDLMTIRGVSDRILFLEKGTLRGLGDPDEMVMNYRHAQGRAQAQSLRREWGTGEVRLDAVEVVRLDGTPFHSDPTVSAHAEGIRIRGAYRTEVPVETLVLGFSLSDAQGQLLFGENTQMALPDAGLSPPASAGQFRIDVPELPLASGVYHLSFAAHSADHRRQYHRIDYAVSFAVKNPREFAGTLDLPTRWRIGDG